MDAATLAAQLVLAAVFVVAGVAKLHDLPGSRRGMANLGVPEQFSAAAVVIPAIGEIVLAAALIVPATDRWAALAAAALLLGYSGGIVNARARGRMPDCRCFGQIYSGPAGWGTIARNLGLAALALFAAIGG
jgi:uncharacterized membrane protein YphA (DoxX/SURF4 family)